MSLQALELIREKVSTISSNNWRKDILALVDNEIRKIQDTKNMIKKLLKREAENAHR